jgi:hypothetical protein
MLFVRLRMLAARLRGTRWLDRFDLPGEDPSIGVREPRRRGPGGRDSAVAVPEPVGVRSENDHSGSGL